MWYEEKSDGFSRSELLKLYQFVEGREKAFREELYRFVNFYSAVCYAVLGLTLSGFFAMYSKNGKTSLFLLFGPFLALIVCILGIRVASRTYRRIIEEVSTKAKLEHLLGLDGKIAVLTCEGDSPIWTEDQALISTRHAKRRLEEKNSKDFIKKSSRRGLFREIRLYFGSLALFTILLSAVIIALRFWH